MKVLLDTDIGSDIDDAVCLAYLLAQAECELMGITTVTGEGMERAKMASALCRVAGQQVPIYPGAEKPLLVAQRQPKAPQAAALSHWSHDTSFPRGQAVEFMRQTIRENPGQITLLSIGPLTNLALLFSIDPEIPGLLKQLVMMCGFFGYDEGSADPLEWNAMLDPHASAIVYRSRPAVHRSVGLDVTRQVTMPADEVRSRFSSKLLVPVLDFAEVWFGERDEITFHDPLAAVTLFDDRVCTFEQGLVEVDLESRRFAGLTRWQPGATGGRHEVAMSVDVERFFNLYFAAVG